MPFVWQLSLTPALDNLLDEDYLEHQEFGGGEIIINQYDLGVSYEFGLSTRF